ncbi:serine protease [Paenibacillus mesophilus]|uniref:CAP domain-containing protein n=1 Tax=Paenibacillus mesophilus TaxID=2582849 RepID=UPI00110EA901|nr:CAP domain-containing protein [Paenibacillus mesophilus]TMV50750.1 serine protease [Paenibacillus mesophilus]
MRFKKSVVTGAIALSVIAGAGSAYAAPSTSAGNDSALKVSQSFGISINDLLRNIQGSNTTIVWPGMTFYIPNTGVDYGTKYGGNKWYYGGNQGSNAGTNQGTTKPDANQGTAKPDSNTGANNGSAGSGQGAGDSATTTASAYADQVVSLVNQERAKAGLSPLASDPALTNMALDKAKDMYNNNYFDHNSPTYGSPFDMMKAYGINYSYAGENIAKGQRNPQEVMNAWMNSQGHRQNILSPNFTKIGVAYYNGEWVQEFIAN